MACRKLGALQKNLKQIVHDLERDIHFRNLLEDQFVGQVLVLMENDLAKQFWTLHAGKKVRAYRTPLKMWLQGWQIKHSPMSVAHTICSNSKVCDVQPWGFPMLDVSEDANV